MYDNDTDRDGLIAARTGRGVVLAIHTVIGDGFILVQAPSVDAREDIDWAIWASWEDR